ESRVRGPLCICLCCLDRGDLLSRTTVDRLSDINATSYTGIVANPAIPETRAASRASCHAGLQRLSPYSATPPAEHQLLQGPKGPARGCTGAPLRLPAESLRAAPSRT